MNENQPPTIAPQMSPAPAQTSALAIWSLVLGILAVVLAIFCVGMLFVIPAVICGHLALSRIRDSGGTLGGRGLAIGGLITGYVALLYIPLLAVIAVPNFMKARHMAQENMCINNLRQMDGAVQQWALEHQKQPTDTPAMSDITPYLKSSPLVCPAGGTYTLHTVAEHPTCSIPGHQLPADNSR